MSKFHLKPTTFLLPYTWCFLLFYPANIWAQVGQHAVLENQQNVALLSVLDPDAATPFVETGIVEAGTYPVQQAAYQSPGIVQRTAAPRASRRTTTEPTFPYTLTAETTVNIYAGPSHSSYATDSLQPGESVDVYRHDPDGWLAIRPPAGSFSLIRASDTRRTAKPMVYEIVQDKAKAWVGTRVEQSHEPINQVRLKPGELVSVQSTIEVQANTGKQLWLQIDPPAGEFRWVHQSEFRSAGRVQASTVATGSAAAYPKTNHSSLQSHSAQDQNGVPLDPESSELQLTDVPPLELTDSEGSPGDAWRAAQRETPELGYSEYGTNESSPGDNQLANVESESGTESAFRSVAFQKNQAAGPAPSAGNSLPVVRAANEWDEAVRRLSQNEHGFFQEGAGGGSAGNSSAALNVSHASVSADNWNRHLTLLNQSLSHEIVKPAEQWSLAPLLQQSQVLLQSAPSASQRDAAATLQKRILGFLQLQKQAPGSNDLTAGIEAARYASAGNSFLPATQGGVAPVQQVSYENPYAAVGYLKELIIDRGRQANSYVLQDANGKTLCHVSPLPGVQLHQYLDQKIGVKGRPGYHAQLKLPHVTVESIDKVD